MMERRVFSSLNKLLDEKDKQIENLQKKLKFSALDHPQT